MFDFLRKLPKERLAGGVYYACRIISHIKAIRDVNLGYTVEGVASEPTKRDSEIGFRIIKEIERAEGLPLNKLSTQTAAQYISTLSILLQELLKDRLEYDDTRGAMLLGHLRRSHPIS